MSEAPPAGAGALIRAHLERVEERNAEVLERVAERMLRTILADGLVFTAGTGHSRAMVLETFFRAGGLACVRPVVHPALDPFEGGIASTRMERVEGLGGLLVEAAGPTPDDTAFVFSNSGTNPVPVEMGEAFLRSGATLVAMSSLEHMAKAPQRAGRKLGDVAEHLLDTGTPYGDAFWEVEGGATAPLSSVTGTFLWSLLLVRLAGLAEQAGARLPLWVSANVDGGEERNRLLLERYRPRIPML